MQILQQRFIRLITSRLGILFFSTLPILAQDSATYTDIFSLQNADSDLSIKMLQLLFGQVGTALNVTTTAPTVNPVVSSLFYIYSLGVLTMVMLLVLYSMVYQAINVSQDGSQGMSKQSSAFLAFRIVLGSSLLLPATGGYNGIQVIVMNIVVYGVAFANYAWTQAYQIAMGEMSSTTAAQQNTEAVKNNMLPYGLTNTWNGIDPNTISWEMTTPRCSQPRDNGPYVTATDLWAMAVCTGIAAKTVAENNANTGNTEMTATYGVARQVPGGGAKPCDSTDDSNWFICFGNTNSSNGQLATACGSIKFNEEVKYNAINNAVMTAENKGKFAANLASTNTQSQITDESGNLTPTGKGLYDCSSIEALGTAPSWTRDWTGFSEPLCTVAADINEIADDYANGLLQQFPLDTSSGDGDSTDENYKSGWATAGQYFQVLSRSLATGETLSAGGGSTPEQQAQTTLTKRGIMATYNYVPGNGTNQNSNTQGNNSAPNTPSCTKQVLCFDVAGAAYPKNLTNFYNAVLPSIQSTDPQTAATAAAKTWNFYSASATQPVASSAAATADENNDSTTSSVDQQTASVQNTAACTLAQNIINACNSLNSDMPAYLQSSNVMNPSNLNSITSGNTNSGSGDFTAPISYQKTDFATTNMMLSVYMTIESLTGMKLFSSPIKTTSSYQSTSNNSGSAAVCTQTSAFNYAQNCNENPTFLQDLFQNNLMVMGNNQSSADTTLAGLFGMTYIQEAGWSNYADPLANLTNLGVTMISAAVFYYTVTMQQLFEAILRISTLYTVYVSVAKVILAGLNALSGGMAEPLFVGTASLVEGFFQMLFALDKFALELFVPLGSAIAGILFTQGVVLGVFLPFLATIIYIFGVLGWLFSVLEAMVAAPLVAMGMTHPEGHDLLGQSEQAMMLLLGVFVRPVAMILGLFSAMAIAKPTMDLVNTGFLFVTSDYFGTTMAGGGAGSNVGSAYGKVVAVSTLGLLMVYTYICYSILEMCYGLISGIPDRLLRWIGGPEQQSQATQMAGKIKQDTQGAAQQGAQGAGQTTRAPQVQPASSGVSVAGAGKEEEKKGNIDAKEDK
ncbi:MAG: hypothetical protein CMF43_01105 [Legionellales bacterium]|nr:hypothetical protein [Legionellales bacterium]